MPMSNMNSKTVPRANTFRWRYWTILTSVLALFLTACGGTQLAAAPTMTQGTSVATPTLEPQVAPASLSPTALPGSPTPTIPIDDEGFADPAYRALWERSDREVADGIVSRSWLWGSPVPSGVRQEPYQEAPDGQRLVEYFDKGRMEINNAMADPSSEWYVTSGLLTLELVTGRVQVGGDAFETLEPADIPVAGDLDRVDPSTPRYADYTSDRLDRTADRTGESVTTQFQRGQGDLDITPPVPVMNAAYDDATGHNVANVFTSYFDEDLKEMELNSLFVMGHPISEPYWINVRSGGQQQLVLVQLFERRVLTYNPANPDGWKVEFGNIGLHYYRWRYHNR